MDTEIRYLELVRGDLIDAARREAMGRRTLTRAAGEAQHRIRPAMAAAAITLLVAGAVGWLVATGGPSRDAATSGAGGGAAAETGATGATAGAVDDQALGGAHATPAPLPASGGFDAGGEPPPRELDRVIRTAQLDLVIPRGTFDERFGDAANVASDRGGHVQDSTSRRRSGDITIRVPAQTFSESLGMLRDLGDVSIQRIQGQDVTAQYVDLRARLRIARARREVLLRLMEGARTIQQTIHVQNALDDTQLRIEEFQGQLNVLDDRTALATIHVSIRERGVDPAEDVETVSIPNAFERSVAGFVAVIAAIVVGLGYAIPAVLIGLVVWFVATRVLRRRQG